MLGGVFKTIRSSLLGPQRLVAANLCHSPLLPGEVRGLAKPLTDKKKLTKQKRKDKENINRHLTPEENSHRGYAQRQKYP